MSISNATEPSDTFIFMTNSSVPKLRLYTQFFSKSTQFFLKLFCVRLVFGHTDRIAKWLWEHEWQRVVQRVSASVQRAQEVARENAIHKLLGQQLVQLLREIHKSSDWNILFTICMTNPVINVFQRYFTKKY